jgi:hypothetical protein
MFGGILVDIVMGADRFSKFCADNGTGTISSRTATE